MLSADAQNRSARFSQHSFHHQGSNVLPQNYYSHSGATTHRQDFSAAVENIVQNE
jgi:hypothetical protein